MIPGLFQAAANGSGAPATSSAPSATDTTSQLSMMLPSQQQVHTHNIMVNIICMTLYRLAGNIQGRKLSQIDRSEHFAEKTFAEY